MPRYQLYLLDEGGHIKEAVSFDVGSDEEAKDYVQIQGEQRAMELWSGSHVIEQYPARAQG